MESKVKLRYYTKDDLQFLHEMLSDKDTVKYFPFMYTTSIEDSNLRLKTRLMDQEYDYANRFVIQDIEIGKPVGEISGREASDNANIMELAIVIHPKYRNMGYAKEGIFEFMKYIINKNKGIEKFRMEIADGNNPSLAVAHKLEFSFSKKTTNNIQSWEKDAR